MPSGAQVTHKLVPIVLRKGDSLSTAVTLLATGGVSGSPLPQLHSDGDHSAVGIHRVIVVDDEYKPTGVVSHSDVLSFVAAAVWLHTHPDATE